MSSVLIFYLIFTTFRIENIVLILRTIQNSDCKRIQFDSEAFNSFVEKLAENFICKFNTYKVVDKMQYSYLSPIHVFLANDIFSISHQNIGKAVELSLEVQENIDDGLRQNAEALLKEHFESLRVAVEETLFKLSQDRQSQYVNN